MSTSTTPATDTSAVKASWSPMIALALAQVLMSFNVSALRTAVAELREAAPGLAIAIGGHAVRWNDAVVTELGVVTAPSDPASLIQFVEKQTGLA